ncbi:hypothetical protein EO94_18975 [Methanosarcina sp. 2.H.T.1A.3]|nr:hypothetical protein EO94_18975 [Methanosarcina sp. 2.H.T.1A.3]KKG23611.1 hypothetical protein EO97_07750 [Methanosarcina sp. 2.H.T.1A.15]
MIRKPDDDISAYLTQGYFQDYLKFLERRKLKLMQTAAYTAAQEIFQELLPDPLKGCNIIVNRP